MFTAEIIVIASLAFIAGAVASASAIWIWMYNAMKPPRNLQEGKQL